MFDTYRNYRIQPNWDIAFREKDNYVWFHEYCNAGATLHHKLYLTGTEFSADSNNYVFSLLSPTVLKLKSDTQCGTKIFQSADRTLQSVFFKDRQPKAHLSCMDIGPSGELALSSSSDKTVCLWETSSGDMRRRLDGHVGEVYSCRFFPSGLAAITAGADMQLKIWCLLSGKCAATLAPGTAGAWTGCELSDNHEPGGHRTGILDTGIIDRGRNIVAIDRFGWLRLWDVSSQVCISGIPLTPDAIRCPQVACPVLEHACCLAVKRQDETPIPFEQATEDQSSWYQALETCSPNATEVGTSQAIVAVGMGFGAAVQLYELRQRSKGCLARFTLPHTTGSIESCVFPQSSNPTVDSSPKVPNRDTSAFTEYGLFAGGQNGELASWDMRYPKEPLMTLTDEKGAVHCIQALSTYGERSLFLIVGRSDGRVMVYRYDPSISTDYRKSPITINSHCSQTVHSTLELTGIDCEPVRGLVARMHTTSDGLPGLSTWTASLSGVFRFYERLACDVAFE